MTASNEMVGKQDRSYRSAVLPCLAKVRLDMTDLEPNEALILFIRKNDVTPARYMAGIRKSEIYFNPNTNDLSLDDYQDSVAVLGEFGSLDEAIDASSAKLKSLRKNVATA
jgi:hypothetical protein